MPVAKHGGDDAELLRWRREFPILAKGPYLVSHSMGAMPRAARASLARYAKEWSTLGVEAWHERWPAMLRETANLAGSLFGAPPGSVVMHQNVSTLVAIALSSLWKATGHRKKVVYTNLNFPSIHYTFAMQRDLGLEVELVESPDGIEIPTEKLCAAIDDRTLAVVVDHGIFRSGYLQDVPAIARAARARGAATIVDAYQTVGCVPIDVTDWGVDFLVGGSHKWLCGGAGAAFLYVRPELAPTLRPRITGWFSHKRPFAFELDMEFADGAQRFATGSPNMPGIFAAREGIAIIAKVGVERVRRKSQRLTQKLIELALAEGLTVNSPRNPSRRSGVVCIDFPGAEQAERALLAKGFQLDYRPRCGLRLSAHFYTKDEELLAIIPELRKLRRKRR